MTTTLHIHLSGGFQLLSNETPATGLYTARLHSLLANLVLLRDAPWSRAHLAREAGPDRRGARIEGVEDAHSTSKAP